MQDILDCGLRSSHIISLSRKPQPETIWSGLDNWLQKYGGFIILRWWLSETEVASFDLLTLKPYSKTKIEVNW